MSPDDANSEWDFLRDKPWSTPNKDSEAFGDGANASRQNQQSPEQVLEQWCDQLKPMFENVNFDRWWTPPNLSGSSQSLESLKTYHEMPYGKKRQDTADIFEVGVSTFPLPYPKRKSPRMSCQSNHRENDQWLGNFPSAEENYIPRGRASVEESRKLIERNSMLSVESLMPDALAERSQPPQNGIPCEDRPETSTMSSRKSKCQDKETHFEEQPTEIQNHNPIRQTIVGTIEGNNTGYISNSITDHMTRMGAKPSVEPISTQPFENIKLHFYKLLALPMKDVVNPENETSIKTALSILTDNLTLFSAEKAEQLLELSLELPILMHNWKECCSQSQMYSQQSSAETENIRDLVENSGKDEESLMVRYEELENKENKLMTELETVLKEKAEIAEQRTEKSKQTKHLISLVKEKEAQQNKEERLMKIATTKLNNLSEQWAKRQSFFI